MKEKALKKDMIHTLETIAHYIKEAKYDYDMEDLRYLFDDVLNKYELYLERKTVFDDMKSMIHTFTDESTPHQEITEGVRAEIRTYLDEH